MFNNLFLTFSDSAKYADVARNIFDSGKFVTSFSFFGANVAADLGNKSAYWISPATPFVVSLFFRIFGVSDFAVIASSFLFYILTLLFAYLLVNKLSGDRIIGLIASISLGFNNDLIHYAVSGASESLFIFEIVAATYFVTLKTKSGNLIGMLLGILMYFTRPQAFIYISGLIFYYLISNYEIKKSLKYFAAIAVIGLLIDKFVLTPMAGNYFIYSILNKGNNILSQVGVAESASNQLRSGISTFDFNFLEVSKKVFYNMYNFYKLLPQIINPFVFGLFLISMFVKRYKEFKLFSLFVVFFTFFVTALSIPFFRYIHPVIPLVYVNAVLVLLDVVRSKKYLFILIMVLTMGQTIGLLFLDSRFEKNIRNPNQPPIYVVLARKLISDTDTNDIIVTNLDTWGSWYGMRKTVWFPITPEMLVGKNFDAIYLTSYKIDDENYYMNEKWREIFTNPQEQKILPEYKLLKEYEINPSENYEREHARAVLLIKR